MRIESLMQFAQKSATLFTSRGKRCILFLFGKLLKAAAEKAFERFPYYARKVVLNEKGI